MKSLEKQEQKINEMQAQGWRVICIWPASKKVFFAKDSVKMVLTKSCILRQPTKTELEQNR